MTALISRAEVPTDNAARYAKQLISHLGRKIEFTQDTPAAWTAVIGQDRIRILVSDTALSLHAQASEEQTLARLEHALGSHLERFGARAGLSVRWHRNTTN
jgi:hypothetical protein